MHEGMVRSGLSLPRLAFEDVKDIMERNLAQRKRGLSDHDIKAMVSKWRQDREELGELDYEVVEAEVRHLESRFEKMNVPRVGGLSATKRNGVFRWMNCQVNGLASKDARERKIREILHLKNKFELNGVSLQEVGLNFRSLPSSQTLHSFFSGAREEMRSASGYNEHIPRGIRKRHLQGGCSVLVFDELLQYTHEPQHDFRGLGRWTSFCFWANPEHKVRIVSAYQVGRGKPRGLETVYQQQMAYIREHDLQMDPREFFRTDFIQQLKLWRRAGERLIVCIDSNEHILRDELSLLLAKPGVDLEEVTHLHWDPGPEPHTYVDGSEPIDGVYKTPDVEIVGLTQLNFLESCGDHRTCIFDVTTRSFIGKFQNKIVRPTARRVTTKQPSSIAEYNRLVEQQFEIHRIPQRMEAIEGLLAKCSKPTPPFLRQFITTIHKQIDEIRIHAERRCRRIHKCALDFSPPVNYWWCRAQAYKRLIAHKEGKHVDLSRAVRRSGRYNIDNPRDLTLQQCRDGLKYCKARQKTLRTSAKGLRKVHLRDRYIAAQSSGRTDKARQVKQRIEREYSTKMWYHIKRIVKDSFRGAILEIEVHDDDGGIVRLDSKDDVEAAIQRECEVRFQLGHSAPITTSLLAEDLRYLSDSSIAEKIIRGEYDIPDGLDNATALLLDEIGKVGMKVIAGHKEIIISADDFIKYWTRVKENTSSSPSGLHHGHYKAAIQSEMLTRVLTQHVNVIVRSGVPPARWSVALQVMLEKIAGVCLVDQLRSIQLYEADFNMFNRFVFGDIAQRTLESAGFLPHEHYAQKESMAEDAVLDRQLTQDISRQSRHPMAIVGIDAAQCYDRVNHLMMALVWLALIGHVGAIELALHCLGSMQFHQRTGFGDSISFFGGPQLTVPFCGLGQGSKSAPASWLQLSSMIVGAYKALGYGATILDPISRAIDYSIGCLFVDDTDLYVWKDGLRSAEDLWEETQASTNAWSSLLCATGGAPKPRKCYTYLIDYTYDEVEGWVYADTTSYCLDITLPDGSVQTITANHFDHCEKTLGVHTSPSGSGSRHLEALRLKAEVWINRLKNGHLSTSWSWVAYRHQLWPSLRYGLGTLANDYEEADDALSGLDFLILPLLGINRHIQTGWRRLHQTFGGVGLLSVPTEQLIARVNMILQHYGSPTSVGRKMAISLRYLQLHLGCTGNPLELDYAAWGHLAPLSWLKMLWRTLDMADLDLRLSFDDLVPPREGDLVIMTLLHDHGYSGASLARLNRCRLATHAIFLSDMATAEGRRLDRRRLRAGGALASRYQFPRETPSDSDWKEWESFWRRYTYDGLTLWRPLGKWLAPTHRRWEWFHDAAEDQLIRREGEGATIFVRSPAGRVSRSSVRYSRGWHEAISPPRGQPASVDCSFASEATLLSTGPPLASGPSDPTDFWKYLKNWGGVWMWDTFHLDDPSSADLSWLVLAVRNNTAVWVTDGSYDRKRAPTVSGAGWIVHCTASGRRLSCSFYERSPAASSYRGELLGLCAIHLFLLALTTFYELPHCHTAIHCDNKGALRQSSWKRRRVKTGAACADLLRSLRSTKQALDVDIVYHHVNSHMDRYLLWHQLSLAQQLNCMCDNLAKTAVHRSMRIDAPRDPSYLLPREDAALFVDGFKQTSDPAKSIRYARGKAEARDFLIGTKKWSSEKFDEVAWEWLDATLDNKPDMFRIWLTKQHTNFCASRVQVGRCEGLSDTSCPNCGKPHERAEHLCVCPCEDRTRLFRESTEKLEQWLLSHHCTHPELAYWIPKYILSRGLLPFAELGRMSPAMARLAASQDIIGWRHFMEGRVSKHLYTMQHLHLSSSPSYLNGGDWMRTFISKVLHITHSQWIFRNITLHDRRRGVLRLQDRVAILREIEHLMLTKKRHIPSDCAFLLEFDLNTLRNSDLDGQQYWVYAVKAARHAGRRVARQGRSSRRSSDGQQFRRRMLPPRESLGVNAMIRQIQLDRECCDGEAAERAAIPLWQAALSRRRPHPSGAATLLGSNKRLCKPD